MLIDKPIKEQAREFIKSLLDRHEEFKLKWLQNNNNTLFDWNKLLEEMRDKRTDINSEFISEKNDIKNRKATRWAELRLETTEAGKKKNTENWIEDILLVEFRDDDIKLEIQKTTIELLTNKIECIPEYINLVKKALPN